MAGFAGECGGANAEAFSEGLGFVLAHPARQVAAETDAPAMTERRVRKNILGPNRKWVSRISTLVKEKRAARYDGYATVTGFLWPDLGERFPRPCRNPSGPRSNKNFAGRYLRWVYRDISEIDIS